MIIIDKDKIMSTKKDELIQNKNISVYFYINEYNGRLIFVKQLNNIINVRLIRKIKSLQELIIEENLKEFLDVIDNIRNKDKKIKVLFKNYIYLSNDFRNKLKSYNVEIEENKNINLFDKLSKDKMKYAISTYTQKLVEENKNLLEKNNILNDERVSAYLEKVTPFYFNRLIGFEKHEIEYTTINDKNEKVKLVLLNTCTEYNNVRKLVRNNFQLNEQYKMNEKYKVCLISPFSFGKSTLLNCLISNNLLKTDIRAETANITKLINSKEKKFLLKNDDNGKNKYQEYFYKDFNDLTNKLQDVTSVRGSGNRISEISILGEFSINKEITFIDSPGLFSRYEHHDKLSLDNIIISNLILFVIDPECVGESNFTEIIKEQGKILLNYKKDFFIVITKRDLYDLDEEKKLLNEIRVILNDIGIAYVDVIFISAYQALKVRQFKNKIIDLEDIRKDRLMFVIENGELIRGKNLEAKHMEDILEFSNIKLLENRIKESLLLYGGEI